ncbi:hypothetical protein WA577_004015 [Blastocystis sp. JDR]
MLGIEVLAHHEHEREGLEVYISEGRNKNSMCAKTFHVLRWIVWLAAILLNFADPIITLVYAILHAKQSAALIWLSSFAILFFVVFALSISVSLSIITLLINILLRIIAYHLRSGVAAFSTSCVFSILSFISIGVVIVFELVDEARNSCK